MISLIGVTLVSLILTVPAFAEKLVDPTTVAPEYREAAEKRRAEQIRQHDCAKKCRPDVHLMSPLVIWSGHRGGISPAKQGPSGERN